MQGSLLVPLDTLFVIIFAVGEKPMHKHRKFTVRLNVYPFDMIFFLDSPR